MILCSISVVALENMLHFVGGVFYRSFVYVLHSCCKVLEGDTG